MIKIDIKKQFTIITFFSAILFCTTSCQFFFGKNPELKEIRLRDAIRIHPNHELGYIRLAQYLEKLHQKHEEWMNYEKQNIPVFTINALDNFKDTTIMDEIFGKLLKFILEL